MYGVLGEMGIGVCTAMSPFFHKVLAETEMTVFSCRALMLVTKATAGH